MWYLLLTSIFWFYVSRGPWWKIGKFKSIISRGPWWQIRRFKSTKVPRILLASDFWYCGLGRGVVGSEGLSRFQSPHSLVGSDEFVLKLIVPTVGGHCDDIVTFVPQSSDLVPVFPGLPFPQNSNLIYHYPPRSCSHLPAPLLFPPSLGQHSGLETNHPASFEDFCSAKETVFVLHTPGFDFVWFASPMKVGNLREISERRFESTFHCHFFSFFLGWWISPDVGFQNIHPSG